MDLSLGVFLRINDRLEVVLVGVGVGKKKVNPRHWLSVRMKKIVDGKAEDHHKFSCHN